MQINNMKLRIEPKTWKDVATVIGIALIPAFAVLPFNKYLPDTLSFIINYYSSTLGYLWLCYRAKKVEVKHIAVVATIVWIIMMVVYALMYWNLIGTEYTAKGIIGGGFLSEAISAVVGCICYAAVRDLKYYYRYYLKGRA
jgi:hypothetical protein